MGQRIRIKSAAAGRLRIRRLHAAAAGERRGGVIVIQEIFGIDQYVRARRRPLGRARLRGPGAVDLRPQPPGPGRRAMTRPACRWPWPHARRTPGTGPGRHRRLHRLSPAPRTGVHRRLLLWRGHGLGSGRRAGRAGGGSSYYGSMVQAKRRRPPNARSSSTSAAGRPHSGRRGQGGGRRAQPARAGLHLRRRRPRLQQRGSGRTTRTTPTWPASGRWSCSSNGA